MQGRLVCAGVAALCCAQGAAASFVGGAFVTDASWNAAASAAIGESVTVYRLFLAFDDPKDTTLNLFGPDIAAAGRLLYQDPISDTTVPPIDALFASTPSLQWDSYVSIGALYQSSTTSIEPFFSWTPNGVFDTGISRSGGWFTSNPFAEEGGSLAPGGVDTNGDQVIPASFDSAYTYTFMGQFTLLGASDLSGYNPVFDGGFIYSDVFSGIASITFNDGYINGVNQGNTEQIFDIPIGVPSPGGASTLLLTMGVFATRRRRSVRHRSPA